MPKILKRFMKPEPSDYVFTPAADLKVGEDPPPRPPRTEDGGGDGDPSPEEERAEEEEPKGPIDYAQIQADAILADARREAERFKEQARQEFEEELERLREQARGEGYSEGRAEGMADAMKQAKLQREQQAEEQEKAVEAFLTNAVRMRDRILDQSKEDLKDLALAIAEKVIRVSLKSSEDILRRMVESATDKKKRCEWVHIYIADCDVKGSANTVPELAAALRNLSNRVRVIPMADDESGTCIIEMPDEILDASVSTQLSNIQEVLSNAPPDDGG